MRPNELTQENFDAEVEARVARGIELFKQGYNCSQSVAMTFADWYDIPLGLMARISASYGGGIGRMRETCGSALGMFMLAGLEIAVEEANQTVKAQNYAAVQQLAADFKAQTGSIICKELLGLNKQRADGTIPEIPIVATPEPRTDEYYKKRPCIRMVETAIRTFMAWYKRERIITSSTLSCHS
ncbi:MAG: C_GCAxxG_C_C family protein [Bacteroidales bacterium]|nr:C_GCAxxG_C_C family protein [Bacteroidales bacterium]